MPTLTDKLKELGVQIGTKKIQGHLRKRTNHNLIDALSGSWETTPVGDCFAVRKEFPYSYMHGSRSLSLQAPLSIFESIQSLKGISTVPLNGLLFIDTETTGLAGGAGTYVFLIGAAKFFQGKVQFAQFFLQEPGSESAQLAALEKFSSDTQAVISYNGKSFDLPRIRTRYRFHDWPNPFQHSLHIDLLHIARRIWKDHLPSCTLGEIETQLLGLERSDLDIPGWKVSQFFYDYLQSGDPEPLKNIFYHNEIDVLSLITFLGYIADRLSRPLSEAHRQNPDLVSIGKYLDYLGQDQIALQVLVKALQNKVLRPEIRLEGYLHLAQIYKRLGQFDQAIPLWVSAAEIGSVSSAVELAKHYEHKAVDLEEAIHWTLIAMDLSSDTDPFSQQDTSQGALKHRLARLKRKAEL